MNNEQAIDGNPTSRTERRWVWAFAALVMAVTLLPYLVGFYRQGSDWRFTGFLFGVQDGNSYIAKMLSGTSGSWLFRTPYTAYAQNGIFLHFPYILLGKLAAAPGLHEQLISLYHLYRLAAGFLAILATYDFIAVFIQKVGWRRFALVLAVLGGGLGWLSIAGLNRWMTWELPIESYSPEGFGFLSIYGLPHLAAARALFLWGLRDFLLHPSGLKFNRNLLRTILLWVGLGIFQPIIQVVGMLVILIFLFFSGAWQLLENRRGNQTGWETWRGYLIHGAQIILIASPLSIYTFLAFKLDPILQTWESQSIIGSPSPLTYLLGYGVALPLALLAVRPIMRENPWRGGLLVGWLLCAPLLAYAPFSSQRRLLEGIWVVMAVLAAYTAERTSPRLRKLALGWLILAFPTTIFLLAAGLLFAWNPGAPLFRPIDEVKAFEYLAENTKQGDVVLAADESANPMLAWVPTRSLVGHGPESIYGDQLRIRIACFYGTGCSDADRVSLLDEFSVDYVVWGPGERELGLADLGRFPFLQQVFRVGDYTVFQTKSCSTP